MKFDIQAVKYAFRSEKHQNIEHLAAELPIWTLIAESKLTDYTYYPCLLRCGRSVGRSVCDRRA